MKLIIKPIVSLYILSVFWFFNIKTSTNKTEDFKIEKQLQRDYDSKDGPYIIGDSIFEVDSNYKLIAKKINREDSIIVNVDNSDNDTFSLHLKKEHKTRPSIYKELSEKLIAISDIEGNFNGFSSFLIANKVIDKNFNWIFGKGHLVLVGDFVDRGTNVTQVLWLIYKLEIQAKAKGGNVHFILGNHEIMNFQGNSWYNNKKYIKISKDISRELRVNAAVKFMYSKKTELGKWLRSKNVIEKIDDYIFVHAGLSPEILTHNLDLKTINTKTRKHWDENLYSNPKNDTVANFLIGRKSPFWYRGLAMKYKYYDKITDSELNNILNYYNSKKIVIGHTVVDNISTDFNGKIINIDVKHGQKKFSGLTKGLLIENGIEYAVNDKGDKTKL